MDNSKDDSLVVDTTTKKKWWEIDIKNHGSAIVIVVLILIIASVAWYKDGFTSPDGVVAGKASRLGVRSDTNVDRTWNLAELEKSVALINRKAS